MPSTPPRSFTCRFRATPVWILALALIAAQHVGSMRAATTKTSSPTETAMPVEIVEETEAPKPVPPQWSAEAAAWIAEAQAIVAQWTDNPPSQFRALKQSAENAISRAQSPDVLLAISDLLITFEHESKPAIMGEAALNAGMSKAAALVMRAAAQSPLVEKLAPLERAAVLQNAAALLSFWELVEKPHELTLSRKFAEQSLALYRGIPTESIGQFFALDLNVRVLVFANRLDEAHARARELMALAKGPLRKKIPPVPKNTGAGVTMFVVPGGAASVSGEDLNNFCRRETDDETSSAAPFDLGEDAPLSPEDAEGMLPLGAFMEPGKADELQARAMTAMLTTMLAGWQPEDSSEDVTDPDFLPPGVPPEMRAMMEQQLAPMRASQKWIDAQSLVGLATSLPLAPTDLLDAATLEEARKPNPIDQMRDAQKEPGESDDENESGTSEADIMQAMQNMLQGKRPLPATAESDEGDMTEGEAETMFRDMMSPFQNLFVRMIDEPFFWEMASTNMLSMPNWGLIGDFAQLTEPSDTAAQWRRWVAAPPVPEVSEMRAELATKTAALRQAEERGLTTIFDAIRELETTTINPNETTDERLAADSRVRAVISELASASTATTEPLQALRGSYFDLRTPHEALGPDGALIVGLPDYRGMRARIVWSARVSADGEVSDLITERTGDFRELVTLLRVLSSDPRSDGKLLRSHAANLYRELFTGAVGREIAAAENVLFLVGDEWSDFPFGALVMGDAKQERFFGAVKNWAVTESLWLVGKNRTNRASTPTRLFAAGLATFDKVIGPWSPESSRRSLPPLPFAAAEASAIAQASGNGAAKQGPLSEARVLDALRTARVVHLSTHGVNDPTDFTETKRTASASISFVRSKGFPGLVLEPTPGAKGYAGDGLLQAWEVSAGAPYAADLVVLSACESGRRYADGVNFPELPRAFIDAGVRSVQAARWSVDDAATAVFMQHFHNALRAGKTAAEATRLAATEMLRDGQHAHPYYWAAFGIFGDPATTLK